MRDLQGGYRVPEIAKAVEEHMGQHAQTGEQYPSALDLAIQLNVVGEQATLAVLQLLCRNFPYEYPSVNLSENDMRVLIYMAMRMYILNQETSIVMEPSQDNDYIHTSEEIVLRNKDEQEIGTIQFASTEGDITRYLLFRSKRQ